MERLEPLVGEWSLEAIFPQAPPSDVRGRVTFEWTLDRQFLVQRSEIPHPTAPDGLAIIAPAADGEGYTQHYFDSRGVVRLYAMTFGDGVWTLERHTPDFSPLDFWQRFSGTFGDEGKSIRGAWEICHDGSTWDHDFELVYRRV
jgi:hypothetical protein